MPENQKTLRAHLEDMQNAVYVAESLVSVILACGDNPKRTALVIEASEAAQKILLEVGKGLDLVNLPKEVAA